MPFKAPVTGVLRAFLNCFTACPADNKTGAAVPGLAG
nr:MAG TPA: hypothetical protein [Caudoviricetes sp.]